LSPEVFVAVDARGVFFSFRPWHRIVMAVPLPYPALHASHSGIWIADGDGTLRRVHPDLDPSRGRHLGLGVALHAEDAVTVVVNELDRRGLT